MNLNALPLIHQYLSQLIIELLVGDVSKKYNVLQPKLNLKNSMSAVGMAEGIHITI